MPEKRSVAVGGEDFDSLQVTVETDGDVIRSAEVIAIGCPELLETASRLRSVLKGSLHDVSYVPRAGHAEQLAFEAVEKLTSRWEERFSKKRIVCPCFKLTAADIDGAILRGCENTMQIKDFCFAGHVCSRCRDSVEWLLKRRRKG